MDDIPSGLLLFGICFGVIGTFVLFLWAVNYLKGWRPSHISTSAVQTPAPIAPANQSVDQSAPTSIHVQTSATPIDGLEASHDAPAPDMDAEQTGLDGWDMPRVSRYLTDDEILTMLAAQKLRDGKWRRSANKIVAMVGGDRTHVLALIRQVREPAPAFRPLSDEQQQLRQQLRLER